MLRLNKRIIFYISLIVVIIIAASIYAYSRSFQYLTVDYIKPIEKVTVEPKQASGDDSTPKVVTVKSGEKLRLKKGSYILHSVGSIIADNPTDITIGDTPVTKQLDFIYSGDYLAELYTKQADTITAALYKSNSAISQHYQIAEPYLYDKGEWFGGILEYTGTDSMERDYLRVVMKQSDGQWKVVAGPSLLLNKYDNKAVPIAILTVVNDLDIGQPVLQNGETEIVPVD